MQQGNPSAFAYERTLNDLQQQHAATAGVAEFGRSLGQRRFSREREDLRRGFSQSQPRFGSSFAQRGMLNSGMYRQGRRDRYRDYQQTQADMAGQQQLENMQWTEQARQRDVGYQNALLRLMEDFQAGRASQNPFENFRLPQTLTQNFQFPTSLIGGGSGGMGSAAPSGSSPNYQTLPAVIPGGREVSTQPFNPTSNNRFSGNMRQLPRIIPGSQSGNPMDMPVYAHGTLR